MFSFMLVLPKKWRQIGTFSGYIYLFLKQLGRMGAQKKKKMVKGRTGRGQQQQKRPEGEGRRTLRSAHKTTRNASRI